MLYYLLWIGVILVVLLVLRMWQPELIYSFRKVLIKVRSAQALLGAEKGAGDTTFSELLVKDLRYETRVGDVEYALERSMKLRELYQMLDLRREDVPGLPMKGRKPQVCIVELSNLMGNLAKKMTPDIGYNYPVTLGANTLLAFIGNELMKSSDVADEAGDAREITARRAEIGALITAMREGLDRADITGADIKHKLEGLESAIEGLINQLQGAEGQNPGGEATEERLLETEVQTAAWFTENPMSIEQVIEIMIAAVNGLAYRKFARTIAQKDAVAGSFFLFNRKKKSEGAAGGASTP